MGRPPLPIGAWGDIYFADAPGGRVMARAQFRGADGVVRPVKRHGKNRTAAKTNLLAALADSRTEAIGDEISKGTRLDELAELFFAEEERLAAQGQKAMTTVGQYRDHYRRHIAKAMGRLQLRECESVSRNHQFLIKLSEKSTSTAVMCRKVLSLLYRFAVIRKAMATNPIRDVGKFSRQPKRKPKALEADQIRDWLAKVDSHEYAVEQDLPDLSRFFLGTGLRISEALAPSWREIDLAAGTVLLDWHLVYLKGQGVVRMALTKGEKEGKEGTTLGLPGWCVDMLRERRRRFGPAGLLGPVFPDPATGKYRDPRAVGKVFRAVRGELGYPWLTSHLLGRKTVATILDEGGATAREIADQLRHAKPSMTQDVYMARGRVNTRAAEILGGVLGTG